MTHDGNATTGQQGDMGALRRPTPHIPHAPPPRGDQRVLEDLDRAVPGFGGFAAHGGIVLVYVTDLAAAAEARAAVARVQQAPEWARRLMGPLEAPRRFGELPLVVRQGRYTYRELATWARVISTAGPRGIPGLVAVGLALRENRVAVTIAPARGGNAGGPEVPNVSEIEHALSGFQIPADALRISVVEAEVRRSPEPPE